MYLDERKLEDLSPKYLDHMEQCIKHLEPIMDIPIGKVGALTWGN